MRRLTQLHERTRRRIGLGGFLLLCLLPTVGMFTWGVSRHLPIEEATVQHRLSELFGLKVTVESIDHPEPGLVRVQGLVFQRPEQTVSDQATPGIPANAKPTSSHTSVRTVATLASLEIRERPPRDPAGELRDTVHMIGTDLAVTRSHLPELTRLFREVIDYRLSSTNKNIAISVNQLRLLDEPAEASAESQTGTLAPKTLYEFSSVQFYLPALKNGSQAMVEFRLVNPHDDTDSSPIRLWAGRRLETGHVWFEFDTRGEEVPCRLLGMILPGFDSLGPNARFCGHFGAGQEPKGWKGEFLCANQGESDVVAKFLNVDLDHLIQRRFAQTFNGQVDITIKKGTFAEGRLVSLLGRVESVTPGKIGQPLLAAAIRELELQSGSIDHTRDMISYQNFAVNFALGPQGLLVDGGYQGKKGEHLILIDQHRRAVLWKTAPMTTLDVTALLRTLAPDADTFIPAGSGIGRLAERLPMTK